LVITKYSFYIFIKDVAKSWAKFEEVFLLKLWNQAAKLRTRQNLIAQRWHFFPLSGLSYLLFFLPSQCYGEATARSQQFIHTPSTPIETQKVFFFKKGIKNFLALVTSIENHFNFGKFCIFGVEVERMLFYLIFKLVIFRNLFI
jgi:hypothetical protein